MRQILLEVPGLHIKVFGYGLMLFFSFLASIQLAVWRARRVRLDPELFYDLALWMFLGGLIGARAFFVVQYWGDKITSLAEAFEIWKGGIVLYGSIIGGAAAFFVYWAIRPFPIRAALDVIAPALVLGIAIGRLGCLMNGCCYGDECNLPWAISFPGPRVGVPGNPNLAVPPSPVWAEQHHRGEIAETVAWSKPVHPTQLYSVLDGLILCGLLSAYFPLRRRDGEVMGLLMLTYPITRYLIEQLRNDEAVFVAGMTISQFFSVVILCGGLAYWAFLSRTPTTLYADQPDAPAKAG